MEDRRVLLVRGDEQVTCRLRWDSLSDRSYRLIIEGPAGVVDEVGADLFDALRNLRRKLELDGWLIAVQGARVDAYASGMVRDMLGARHVYLIQIGRHVAREHLVDIFAEADKRYLSTLEEQAEFFERWKVSRAETPPPG